ncbi:MAG: LuxR C-terminal-related transcriptional regulator [Acidimicrobiia bacterium]|nr:LuxR C-terminal-related transcriptional regulator [Acidimicrobiia bacterium]
MGRLDELAVFGLAIADARHGLPSILLVGGEAGIGKTTLVAEGAAHADVARYLGRPTHIGGQVIPLAPLADLLRQVRRAAPDLLTGSPELAPLGRWFNPGTVTLAPSEVPYGGLFLAVLELVTQLADDDAVVIGFEDLHWADSVTWDLFEYLARNLIDERVVLVGTYRPNEVGIHAAQRRRLAELSRLPGAHRIQLQGLSRDDVALRIAALIGTPPPPALVDHVVARGQGNPFFTQELVAAHLSGETIPLVLSDLISADISGLGDNARQVLGAVAAMGRDMSHQLLVAIVDLKEGDLEVALRTVTDAQLLIVGDDSYHFRHPLLSEVVYADLLPPQRFRLHRRIAGALRQQQPDVLIRPDRAGELAFQLDRSGDYPEAFVTLLAAADAAETVAPAAALGHLERAFELWDAAGPRTATVDRRERLWQAADLATNTVGNKRAVALARAAFDLGPPRLGAAWGHARLGRYLWFGGELEESRIQFALAAEMLSGDEGPEAGVVFAGLGQAALISGDYRGAERWCEKVFSLLPTPEGNESAWVRARRVLGIVRSSQGDPDRAIELCREAVVAATDAQARALATVYLCLALIEAGRYQEAVNTALDAVADGRLTGLDQGFGCYLDSLAAEALIRLGQWRAAAAILARQPVPNTFPVGLLRLALTQAMLAGRRGDRDLALSRLAEAAAQPVDGWHQAVFDATAAWVHLALGNWEDAALAAERGWESTQTTSVLWAVRFAMLGVAAKVEETLDELARRQSVDLSHVLSRLHERIDAAHSLARHSNGSLSRDTAAHLALSTASVTRLTGSDPDAWTAAAIAFADLGDRWLTATTRLREAEAAALHGSADRAATALRQAHSVATELGAAPLLSEIDAVSRRIRISLDVPTRLTLDESTTHSLGLTPREADVLALVAAGRTNRQIGEELYVSDKTASVHVSNILRKLGVKSRVDAAAVAQRLGIA